MTYAYKHDVCIAYIYCNYKDKEQTSVNLLGSLLQQVVRQSRISNEIKRCHERHTNEKTRPSVREYSELLRSHLRIFAKVFLIIDALDECSEKDRTRDQLLSCLPSSSNSKTSKLELEPYLHLLVTSRPHITDIPDTFSNSACLNISGKDQDIKIYLDERIREEKRLKDFVQQDSKLGESIRDIVTAKAKGMSVPHEIPFMSTADYSTGFFWLNYI